jgi:hypothetical protein
VRCSTGGARAKSRITRRIPTRAARPGPSPRGPVVRRRGRRPGRGGGGLSGRAGPGEELPAGLRSDPRPSRAGPEAVGSGRGTRRPCSTTGAGSTPSWATGRRPSVGRRSAASPTAVVLSTRLATPRFRATSEGEEPGHPPHARSHDDRNEDCRCSIYGHCGGSMLAQQGAATPLPRPEGTRPCRSRANQRTMNQ